MHHLKRISDHTRLVLGDWVCTPPDKSGSSLMYRLVAWSASTQRWLLYRDGVDPLRSGWPGLMMLPEDLMAKGYRKFGRRRTNRCAHAPVYLMQRTSPQVLSVLRPGTDPRRLA
jgi:hypothetical protein